MRPHQPSYYPDHMFKLIESTVDDFTVRNKIQEHKIFLRKFIIAYEEHKVKIVYNLL